LADLDAIQILNVGIEILNLANYFLIVCMEVLKRQVAYTVTWSHFDSDARVRGGNQKSGNQQYQRYGEMAWPKKAGIIRHAFRHPK
ncbi:MAG: hypothetical protein DRG34_05260, partial [Deltaproteobacteria bacterium]